jgi:hypothetical protein
MKPPLSPPDPAWTFSGQCRNATGRQRPAAPHHPELSWTLLDRAQALATATAEFSPLLRDPEPTPSGELS